jgi:hypothetical protein
MPVEQRILLAQAAPGMVLARDVTTAGQVKLVGKGTTLDALLIARLDGRQVRRIHVQGRPIPGPTPEQQQAQLDRLAERFARVQDQPLMVDLQRAVERILRKRWTL